MFTTFISTQDLIEHLHDANWVIVDCRFSLDSPQRGRVDYLQAHIPGAVHAHMNEDLSAPHEPGVTGRHPLPSIRDMAATFSSWGIHDGCQVIGYDDSLPSGGMAARLWWCLRWLGHDAVAVLDGGWASWLASQMPVTAGMERRMPATFTPRPRPEMVLSVEDVQALRNDPTSRLLDSRSADRYRGENETIDPIAGHIPGAISAPYAENATADGKVRSVGELKERFRSLLGITPPQRAAFYCGSGVTAAYNLLAMEHAGLPGARLYAGSWSEWITDPNRPVATGTESAMSTSKDP